MYFIMCIVVLLSWATENVLTIGIKAEIPKADGGHELLGLVQLAVPAKDGIHELGPRVLAELGGFLGLLAGLEHGRLTGLEELLEFVSKALPGLDEVIHHLLVLLGADARHAFFGALDLTRELNQEEPQLSGHVGDGRGGTVVVDGPVIDPLAKTVSIKNATKEHDGFFRRVPVLE